MGTVENILMNEHAGVISTPFHGFVMTSYRKEFASSEGANSFL